MPDDAHQCVFIRFRLNENEAKLNFLAHKSDFAYSILKHPKTLMETTIHDDALFVTFFKIIRFHLRGTPRSVAFSKGFTFATVFEMVYIFSSAFSIVLVWTIGQNASKRKFLQFTCCSHSLSRHCRNIQLVKCHALIT